MSGIASTFNRTPYILTPYRLIALYGNAYA